MAQIGPNPSTTQAQKAAPKSSLPGNISVSDFANNAGLVALGAKYGDTPDQINDCLGRQEHYDPGNDSFPAGERQKENVTECLDPQSRQLFEEQKHYHQPSELKLLGMEIKDKWNRMSGKPTDGF